MNTMTSPTQPGGDAVERALHARVPGGAEVWHWLPMDGNAPHETARNIMSAAISAAHADLVAEVARLQKSLDDLHGAPFSDRCYHALKSRAETAERKCDALTAELARRDEAGARDARDAALWRALLGCARIRLLGWAGLDLNGNPMPDRQGYVHFGAEFWTHHGATSEPSAELPRRVLTRFAKAAAAIDSAAEGKAK